MSRVILLALTWLLGGCGQAPAPHSKLHVWAHSGREGERRVLQRQVERFQTRYPGRGLQLTFLPEGGYNSQVQAAALAGQLPDLLEFDGPFVYSYVWQGCLQPLDAWIGPDIRDNLLPSLEAQGRYRGRLYCLGNFDSGLCLYARKSLLARAGARLPETPAQAWSAPEFCVLLERLAALDEDGQVLDLKLNYQGEWLTYGFSPVLSSAGGALFSESEGRARGHLNSPASVAALKLVQSWVRAGQVDPNLDDDAFVSGRVALSWVGHWEYPRYYQRWGQDLALLPLPNFGKGSKSAQGSWNWGLTTKCSDPQRAAQFLEYLLQDQQVCEMTAANGAVPATRSAGRLSPLYARGGGAHFLARQLAEGSTVPRPRTPAYPVITSVFQDSLQDIFQGADVAQVLDSAAMAIDTDVSDNQGYP